MATRPSRALFILNPASGKHDADETEQAVVGRLEESGVEVEVRRTEGEGDARDWAGEAAAAGDVDVVLVGGGDGSVREAVSGVVAADGDLRIAVVPLGTANLVARALGIPVDDPAAAAATAADGTGRTIDVFHLLERDDHAVLMVDAGFDAQLVRDSDRGNKDKLGPFAYVMAGIRNLFDLDEVDIAVTVDGERRTASGHSVFCLNIGQIGETVVVDHDIQPDDGTVHIGVVGEDGSFQAAKTAVEMVVGDDREDHDNVTWTEGTRVRVEADPPLEIHVDGDPAGETPFEIELLPGAATIMVPAEER